MKIIDISWPISKATTGYKDKNTVQFYDTKEFAKDNVRGTSIHISSHTGTHVDAPSHFLKDGKTVDQITLDRVMGKCTVIDMTHCTDGITRDDLASSEIEQGTVLLLKTTNSHRLVTDSFDPHFIFLESSGAAYLAEKKVKAVGIDYLGIERGQPDHPTHKTLMQSDVVIIEGLRLAHVEPGTYFLICLPLAVMGLEAAPARAVLMAE